MLFCTGIVIAAEGEDTDYSFIDCIRDQGANQDSSKIDVARAAIACKEYIDTEELKLKFEDIKAKIEEAELREKMALFQACMEENGVSGLADLREVEDPRAILGQCMLAAGIDMEELKAQAKEKAQEALGDKAEAIKTCISELDLRSMERSDAIEAVRACFDTAE